eukprot:2891995-Rhodomonas_salina.1
MCVSGQQSGQSTHVLRENTKASVGEIGLGSLCAVGSEEAAYFPIAGRISCRYSGKSSSANLFVPLQHRHGPMLRRPPSAIELTDSKLATESLQSQSATQQVISYRSVGEAHLPSLSCDAGEPSLLLFFLTCLLPC